ncbi:MAG: hypothetical protein AAGA66_04645 [Bacteroidota bacterium]
MRRRNIRWILIFIVGTFIFYVAYETELRYVINDYQISYIEKQLVKNFDKHSRVLQELTELTKDLKEFELSFSEEKELFLNIESVDYENDKDLIYISIEGDSIAFYEISLQPKDVEQLISESVLFDTLEVPDWSIYYSGEFDSQIASILLMSRGIDQNSLGRITNKLKEANCVGISRTKSSIKIRFKGHRFESFNYVFITNPNESGNLNKLTGNFYWEHFKWCCIDFWTNWGWI